MKKKEKDLRKDENSTITSLSNNNGSPFPSISGQTDIEYYSNSTSCNLIIQQNKVEKNSNFYTLNLDWLQFVCTTTNPNIISLKKRDSRIVSEKVSFHNVSNFKQKHRIYLDSKEICEVYTILQNPEQNGHPFRFKAVMHSGAKRTPIPF